MGWCRQLSAYWYPDHVLASGTRTAQPRPMADLVQAFSKLIIVEKEGRMYAIDQHAADERVRLERGQDAMCACLTARSQRASTCHPSTSRPATSWPAAAPDTPVPVRNSGAGASNCTPVVLEPSSQSVDGSTLNRSDDLLLSRRLKSTQVVHVSLVQRLRLCQPQIQVHSDTAMAREVSPPLPCAFRVAPRQFRP